MNPCKIPSLAVALPSSALILAMAAGCTVGPEFETTQTSCVRGHLPM